MNELILPSIGMTIYAYQGIIKDDTGNSKFDQQKKGLLRMCQEQDIPLNVREMAFMKTFATLGFAVRVNFALNEILKFRMKLKMHLLLLLYLLFFGTYKS